MWYSTRETLEGSLLLFKWTIRLLTIREMQKT
jgi:hypothetical protein